MKKCDEQFAERFKAAVAHAGVDDTQIALGKFLGVSGVTVWSYRKGEKLPRMKKASEIAQKLGVNVNWLMTGNGEMTNDSELSELEKKVVDELRNASEAELRVYLRSMGLENLLPTEDG